MIVSYSHEKRQRQGYFLVALLSFLLFPLVLLPLMQQEEALFLHVEEKRERTFALERIGTGPLSLEVLRFPRLVERIKDELLFLSLTTRPNYTKGRMVLLGLKSATEMRRIVNGQPFYLYDEGGGRLRFSAHPTPLALTATLVDPMKVALTVVRKKESEEERAELLMMRSNSPFLPNDEPHFFQELKAGKCLGQDLVLKSLKGKMEECRFQLGESLYHLKNGDLLLWKSGEWKVVSQEETKGHLPLARVRRSTPQGIEFEVWDGGAFSCGELKFAAVTPPKPLVGAREQFSGLKLRSKGEVVAVHGKRRVILRGGDWLLKQGDRIRHLRRPQEISELLALRLQGELFIVEGIHHVNEKALLKVLHFDEMRLQSEEMELPIAQRDRANIKKERHIRLPGGGRT